MEKLSEAGVLYLTDYQILNEAKKEVERYLNSVVEEVNTIVSSRVEELTTDKIKVNLWENQSSKGHIDVYFASLTDSALLRRDKADIYVVYKDIRNLDNNSPTSARVSVWTPNVASKFEKVMKKKSLDKLEMDIYESVIIEFDLSNSMDTAQRIADEMLSKCETIVSLLEEIQ